MNEKRKYEYPIKNLYEYILERNEDEVVEVRCGPYCYESIYTYHCDPCYIRGMPHNLFAAQRNGYWGLVLTWETQGQVYEEGVTPFAFTNIPERVDFGGSWNITGITGKEQEFFIVDRFGKKGVLIGISSHYLIPCDYEKIDFSDYESAFSVEKEGLIGKIGVDGKWIERLH